MTDTPPVIHVVDDDDSLRTALLRLLGAAGFEARRPMPRRAISCSIRRPTAPGCLLLDLRMPGPSGLDLQDGAASARACALPVIFLTGHGDVPTGVRAMKAGAVDFLTKPVEREAAARRRRAARCELDAARRASRGAERATCRHGFAQLTPRECEVLELVVAGKLNKQIADDAGHRRAHRQGAAVPGHGQAGRNHGCRTRRDRRPVAATRRLNLQPCSAAGLGTSRCFSPPPPL